jgi:hypothetical protein
MDRVCRAVTALWEAGRTGVPRAPIRPRPFPRSAPRTRPGYRAVSLVPAYFGRSRSLFGRFNSLSGRRSGNSPASNVRLWPRTRIVGHSS